MKTRDFVGFFLPVTYKWGKIQSNYRRLKAQQQPSCNSEITIFLLTIYTQPYCYAATDVLFVFYSTNALLMRGATASVSCCIHFLSRWFCPSLISCTSSKMIRQMQMKWQRASSNVMANYFSSITQSVRVFTRLEQSNKHMYAFNFLLTYKNPSYTWLLIIQIHLTHAQTCQCRKWANGQETKINYAFNVTFNMFFFFFLLQIVILHNVLELN